MFSGTDEVYHPVQAHRFAWPWHIDLAPTILLRHCHYLLLLVLIVLLSGQQREVKSQDRELACGGEGLGIGIGKDTCLG